MNHDDTPIETSEREARPWKPSDGYLPAGGDDEHPAANERSAADAIAAPREAIERDGWQPIETMPRTGRMVLMWSRNAGYFAGNWPQGCAAGDWHKISGDWRGGSHWRAQDATHWRPLPDAPKD